MERSKITPFAVLVLLWGYLLSVLLAQKFWGAVFDRLIGALDLTYNQAWILPLGANLIITAIAAPTVLKHLHLLRKGTVFPRCQRVTWLLCLVGVCLCLWGAIAMVLTRPKHLASAIGEFLGGKTEKVFAAGEIGEDSYSNALIGLSLKLPSGWHPMSLNAIDRAQHSGAQGVFGTDTEQARTVAAARRGSYPLLAVHKYREPHAGYNPGLSLSAYEKEALAATGIADLEAYANSFAGLRSPYHVRRGPVKEALGALDCYYLHIEGQFPQATIQQHVYVTETATLYVVLVASVMNETDFPPLKEAVSTLCIRQH